MDLLTCGCSLIEQLRMSLREQEGLMKQKADADHGADAAAPDRITQLTILIGEKDHQLQACVSFLK